MLLKTHGGNERLEREQARRHRIMRAPANTLYLQVVFDPSDIAKHDHCCWQRYDRAVPRVDWHEQAANDAEVLLDRHFPFTWNQKFAMGSSNPIRASRNADNGCPIARSLPRNQISD